MFGAVAFHFCQHGSAVRFSDLGFERQMPKSWACVIRRAEYDYVRGVNRDLTEDLSDDRARRRGSQTGKMTTEEFLSVFLLGVAKDSDKEKRWDHLFLSISFVKLLLKTLYGSAIVSGRVLVHRYFLITLFFTALSLPDVEAAGQQLLLMRTSFCASELSLFRDPPSSYRRTDGAGFFSCSWRNFLSTDDVIMA